MNSKQEKGGWFIHTIGFMFFCESDDRRIDLFFGLILLVLGLLGLIYWYSSGYLEPSVARGAVGWLIFVIFLSKPMNLIDCGGPIPAAILGFVVIYALESWANLT